MAEVADGPNGTVHCATFIARLVLSSGRHSLRQLFAKTLKFFKTRMKNRLHANLAFCLSPCA